MKFVYISLSGNTKAFVEKLVDYLAFKHPEVFVETLDVKELVKGGQDYPDLDQPYVAFLPTYLEGGNGVDTGDQEILTGDLRQLIAKGDNASNCLGIVGSGNRNFNNQFCLTAYQYSKQFNFPVLDVYEMRGLTADVERIAEKIYQVYGFEN
ncbi:class Ib ribonucleoside-diphosphate reductase assembly flavoprotein NrdI [Streptococcus dentapri]|uniref:Putative NrdI-like protein n=1 Tax=Streptococcus dentapri TaxID=573564 RepID=A0ABV8D3H1_9STRE